VLADASLDCCYSLANCAGLVKQEYLPSLHDRGTASGTTAGKPTPAMGTAWGERELPRSRRNQRTQGDPSLDGVIRSLSEARGASPTRRAPRYEGVAACGSARPTRLTGP
jgi:hypothetical protein